MHKLRKLQLKDQRQRTLKICFPHVIKDKKDVENLFVGDFSVKLPRQTSRSCHVVFSSVEEKVMNYQLAKNKTVNGKHVMLQPLHINTYQKEAKLKKKIFMPKIKPHIEVTQTVFIGNIVIGIKSDEIKGALPGCISVTLLKPYNKDFRSAIAKMENIQIAAEYLKKERKWPILRGHKVCMKTDNRTKHKRRKVSTGIIEVYNENTIEKHKSSERCKNLHSKSNKNVSENNDESK